MMNHFEVAKNICEHFEKLPDVKKCRIYGSLNNGNYDEFSDIGIEIDVSGSNNGEFLKCVPGILNELYHVIFSDYAPSLLPDEYVVSCAISTDNPFLIVDIKCIAKPHIKSVTKQDIPNNKNNHILKLWVANTKHYLRGKDCENDIKRMYKKVFGDSEKNPKDMLIDVLEHLKLNCSGELIEYINSCEKYTKLINMIKIPK